MASDDELLRRVQRRDANAFDALLKRHGDAVRRRATAIVHDRTAADDLLQETFLRVWMRADQWDGGGSARGWLLRIATNLALNHLRSVKRRRDEPLSAPADAAQPPEPNWLADRESAGPAAEAETAELGRILGRLVEALPEQKREVYRMARQEGADLRTIAEELDIPLGTVKSRLHDATRRLVRQWNEIAAEWEDAE
ncbi:MAG: RNA polymerase sigma factor [Phycisphaerae bacterium]